MKVRPQRRGRLFNHLLVLVQNASPEKGVVDARLFGKLSVDAVIEEH